MPHRKGVSRKEKWLEEARLSLQTFFGKQSVDIFNFNVKV
jgi:hypothetical protein